MARRRGVFRCFAGGCLAALVAGLVWGCASTEPVPVKASPRLTGSLAVAPPLLSAHDIYTGREFDREQLAVLADTIQFTSQRILQQKGYALVASEKTNQCIKSALPAASQGAAAAGPIRTAPSSAQLNCLKSMGVDFLVCEDIKAKAGIKKRDLGSSDGMMNPYFLVRDPNACSVKVLVYDVKNGALVWQNEVYRRENITEEAVMQNLLNEIFNSMAAR
jgi:hypothetical protein